MAYFILNPNETNYTNIYKIAADDDAKSKLNLTNDFISVNVSDSEFANIRNNTKSIASHDGTSYTYVDFLSTETDPNNPPSDPTAIASNFETSDQLRQELDIIANTCNQFIESNADHPWRTSIQTYKDYLVSFDTTSVTFPMTISWEKYCEDNSISYYHPLQIP